MTTSNAKKRGAFTLLELLVVVAIIVLLIAVLVPSLARARENARQVKCATNLKQWALAAHVYASDNNDVLPCKGGDGTRTPSSGEQPQDANVGNWDDNSLWFNALPLEMGTQELSYGALQDQDRVNGQFLGDKIPHAGTNSIFICPSAFDPPQGVTSQTQPQGAAPDTMWNNGSAAQSGSFFMLYGQDATDPNYESAARPFLICYQWNSKLVTPPPNQTIYNVDTKVVNTACPKLVDLASASPDLVLMSEKRIRQDELKPTDPENPSVAIDSSYNYYYYPIGQAKGNWERFTTRHFDGGNIAFIDGRVEYFKYHDVVTPTLPPTGANTNSGDWNQPGKLVWNPNYAAN